MAEHLATLQAPHTRSDDATGPTDPAGAEAKAALAAGFPCTNFRVISIEGNARDHLFEMGPDGQRHSAGRVRKLKRDKEKKKDAVGIYSATTATASIEDTSPTGGSGPPHPHRPDRSGLTSAQGDRTPGPPAGGAPYTLQAASVAGAGIVGRPPTDDERRKVMMKEKRQEELDLKSLLSLTRPLQHAVPGGGDGDGDCLGADPALLRSELRKRLSFKRAPGRGLLESDQQTAAAAAAVSKQVDRAEPHPRRPVRNGPSSAQVSSEKRKGINASLKLPRSGSAAVAKTSLSDATMPSTSWPSITSNVDNAGRVYQVGGEVGGGGYLSGPFRRLGIGKAVEGGKKGGGGVGEKAGDDVGERGPLALGADLDPFFGEASGVGGGGHGERPERVKSGKHRGVGMGVGAVDDPSTMAPPAPHHRRLSEDSAHHERESMFMSSLMCSAQDPHLAGDTGVSTTTMHQQQRQTDRPVSRQRLPTDALDLFPVDPRDRGAWTSVDMFASPGAGGKKGKKKRKQQQQLQQQQQQQRQQAFLSDGSSNSSSDDIEQHIAEMHTKGDGEIGATKAGVDFSCLFLDDEDEFGGAFPTRKQQSFRVTETNWSRCDAGGLVPAASSSTSTRAAKAYLGEAGDRGRGDREKKVGERGNYLSLAMTGASERAKEKGPVFSEDDNDQGDAAGGAVSARGRDRDRDTACIQDDQEFAADVLDDFKPSTSRVMVLESVDGDHSSPDEKYFESLYGLLKQTKASPVHPQSAGSPMKGAPPHPAPSADRERERSEALAHISRPASVRAHHAHAHPALHAAHPMSVADLPSECMVPQAQGGGGASDAPPVSIPIPIPASRCDRVASGKRRPAGGVSAGIADHLEGSGRAVGPPVVPVAPSGGGGAKRLPSASGSKWADERERAPDAGVGNA